MLKFTEAEVTFSEVPDEITLCINISNCPNHCPECHSKWLWEDIGKELTEEELSKLITNNKGITCVAFLGGDNSPKGVNKLAEYVKQENLLTCWYSGKEEISKEIELRNFDFIKLGPYKKECGPLSSPHTNQKFFEVNRISKIPDKVTLHDITHKFQEK